jgi:hypothetical protein
MAEGSVGLMLSFSTPVLESAADPTLFLSSSLLCAVVEDAPLAEIFLSSPSFPP